MVPLSLSVCANNGAPLAPASAEAQECCTKASLGSLVISQQRSINAVALLALSNRTWLREFITGILSVKFIQPTASPSGGSIMTTATLYIGQFTTKSL